MKKIQIIIIMLLTTVSVCAQQVIFEFSDGIDEGQLKAKMEGQMSALLTAINTANAANGDINFSGIDITDDASGSLTMTWEQVH